jgi:Zn-dependent peptidase ImmA (M78 family)
MPTQITQKQIIKRALELRTNHSIDIVKLANDIGIQVYSSKNISMSGKISCDKNTGQISIYVNESEPITRQRFSVAHEIAHFVLHPSELLKSGCLNRDPNSISSAMENY